MRANRSRASSTAASPSSSDKLGPIVWQFMPTKQFDAEDFEAFLRCCRRRRAAARCAT
jgi:uncharacterized protein YecE (DUF72 family)